MSHLQDHRCLDHAQINLLLFSHNLGIHQNFPFKMKKCVSYLKKKALKKPNTTALSFQKRHLNGETKNLSYRQSPIKGQHV